MLQAFYSNMFSISFSVNSVLELFLTTNIVYNTLYKEGGLSMKPYLFRLEQECEHLAATEYIYEIGTFHYNWHKDLEILVILKGSVEVCTENKLFFLEEDDVTLINSNNPDLWFIGFTPYYIGGVWMGYDIQEEIHYSTYPTPIFWKNIFPATSTYVLNCVQMPKVKICSLTA